MFSNGVRGDDHGGARDVGADDGRGHEIENEQYHGSGSCAFHVGDLHGDGRDVCESKTKWTKDIDEIPFKQFDAKKSTILLLYLWWSW